MLLLVIFLVLGALLLSGSPRLERGPGAYMEASKPAVRAWVDGKPVKSYLKED